MGLKTNVLRGKEHVGENLIEITDGKTKILIECGVSLNPSERSQEIERVVLSTHYDAIIISHSHLDHAGLLKSEVKADVIYMGESTYKLLTITESICENNRQWVRFFESEKRFYVGDVEIICHLCDHSSYDSYMIEIRKDEEIILYTGDFRSNGRKSFKALLERLPNKINTLITEETNPLEHNYTERYLEEKAYEIMRAHKRVFFLQSRQNIDRLVSFYKATRRTGKPFIMGTGSAEISRIGKSIPNPQGFGDCYTYFRYRVGDFEYTSSKDKYKSRLIGRREIATFDRFSMQVMGGMGDYLKKLSNMTDLKGSVLIYSMWQGYKERAGVKRFLAEVRELGIEVIDLHVSGHADKATRKMLVDRVNPDNIISVHREKEEIDISKPITVIDIETDGIRCENGDVDRIIKIEAVKLENKKITEKFSTLVASDRRLNSAIISITGIKNEDLENAPSIDNALTNLYLFSYGTQIVVYNKNYASNFLNYYARERLLNISFPVSLDILLLAREKLNGKIKRFRLRDVLGYFGEPFENSYVESEAKVLFLLQKL